MNESEEKIMNENTLRVYEESLEGWPVAHEKLKAAYKDLSEALDAYIEEIQKHAFCWGYEIGRKAGE